MLVPRGGTPSVDHHESLGQPGLSLQHPAILRKSIHSSQEKKIVILAMQYLLALTWHNLCHYELTIFEIELFGIELWQDLYLTKLK